MLNLDCRGTSLAPLTVSALFQMFFSRRLCLLAFPRLSVSFSTSLFVLVFIYPLNYCFPLTYVNGVTFLCFALVLLRSLSGTTHVCNLFVICLSACPYCNFTGLLLVCSSVFPGRVMPSLLASLSFPLLSFLLLKDFMWVSLIVLFLTRKAVVYTFVFL